MKYKSSFYTKKKFSIPIWINSKKINQLILSEFYISVISCLYFFEFSFIKFGLINDFLMLAIQ